MPDAHTRAARPVWEWTRSLWGKDWQEPQFKYPYVSTDGREDLKAPADVHRVVRGGAFSDDRRLVWAAYRGRGTPDYRSSELGFRVVVSLFSSEL